MGQAVLESLDEGAITGPEVQQLRGYEEKGGPLMLLPSSYHLTLNLKEPKSQAISIILPLEHSQVRMENT